MQCLNIMAKFGQPCHLNQDWLMVCFGKPVCLLTMPVLKGVLIEVLPGILVSISHPLL